MRKTFIAFICLVAGLLSCTNDDNFTEEQMPVGVPMTFNISVDEGVTTRAAKTAWASGDKIYVFFYGLATKYLILTYDGSAWTNTSGGGDLLSTDFSGLGTKTITAIYFPVAVDVAYADSKFSFTSGGKPVYNYYLYETGKAYTVGGTTVTVTLSMGKPADMVQIHVAGIQNNVGDYTFGCSMMKPVACASVGTDGAITESVLQAGAPVSGVADSDGGIFAGRLVYPGVQKNYEFTIASDYKIYTMTRTDKTLTAGKMYNFPSLSTTGEGNWTVSDAYVDLGLPSGLRWASCNLCEKGFASAPYVYGDYFAWGETEPYYSSQSPLTWKDGKSAGYDWASYQWCNGTSLSMTKYCTAQDYGTVDNRSELEAEDDAAHVILGGNWRMPTPDDFAELMSECEWGSATRNGVNGCLVTGSNGKSIFLPFAGLMEKTSPNDAGNVGYYWSSVLSSQSNRAEGAIFDFSNQVLDMGDRKFGLSIRPVYDFVFVPVTGVSLNKSSLNLLKSETATLTATVTPSDATHPTVTWSTGNAAVATVSNYGVVTAVGAGNTIITATTVDGDFTAICTVKVESIELPTGAIDLGLPSGVKWASCNLSETGFVSAPYVYGDYFAWGETEPYYTSGHAQDSPCTNWKTGKTGYNWASYTFELGTDHLGPFSKYVTANSYGIGNVDGKSVLGSADDAASDILGNSWHIPTVEEWAELEHNCTWKTLTVFGVKGRLATGPNGNSIFLPAAGVRGADGDTRISYAGDRLDYWSSTLTTNEVFRAEFFYTRTSTNEMRYSAAYRYLGMSIRPVKY